ncbi:hypothetical protein HPP92_012877 [Vanilla planifolia]|uniref:RING-type domain-containing protein n=1 Tax=Vanilla planifolia TaxID=51239 RepID=A0A835UY35_VANPL|nr:hypothetical protein HPP92_012877 [Vanilla planifolia]
MPEYLSCWLLYGESDFLLFDLLELADYIKAKKLHLIYDKRQHPKQSLLQHNLGDFQGSSLTVIIEGATLSIEEVGSLQLPPPWKIRNKTLNYGLGLIGSYFVCDIMTLVSGGYFYIFDPLGLVLGPSSEIGPSAKLFSLIGFFIIYLCFGIHSHAIIFKNAWMSTELVAREYCRFLKDSCVSLSTWEEGNLHPTLDYSVSIDPSSSVMRNPFSEKKWRKFNISRLFSSSHGAVNMHVIDVLVRRGETSVLDKWLVVLCLGSGQTRNMALDRHYLSYNLTPVAGVAAHISQNGQPINPPASSCILSPLPLSGEISMPVTVLGCFLIFHNGGRYLFSHSNGDFSRKHISAKDPATTAWNKELLLCIRDSYVELVSVLQKVRKNYLNSPIESSSARALSCILLDYGDRLYSFWPRSIRVSKSPDEVNMVDHEKIPSKASEAQWALVVEQVIRPFYARIVDLPVWQLYGGNVVKAEEGMFLSQSGCELGDNLLPDSVYTFIKEHYPVFSVPCELVMEIQAIGVKVSQITPKMIRSLLKVSVSVVPQSIQSYIDVLDYCLSDIQMPDVQQSEISGYNNRVNSASSSQIEMYPVNLASSSSSMNMQRSSISRSTTNSGGDALEIVSYLGKALYDFGRGVVEDIGRVTDPTSHVGTTYEGTYGNQSLSHILAELKGLPFPTATMRFVRLGSAELWIGNQDQQLLMHPLADKFVHTLCLEKPYLAKILCSNVIHRILKLRSFTFMLLSDHLGLLFAESWVNNVLVGSQSRWVPWKINARSLADGPSPEWLRLFWKIFKDVNGDLSLVAEWPFIPAILNGPILCRVKDSNLVFVPPLPDPASFTGVSNIHEDGHLNSSKSTVEELRELYLTEFESISNRYPWLLALLYQLSIPVYDMSFLDIGMSCNLFPTPNQSLGQVIISKLHAAKCAGSFSIPLHLFNEDRDRLFALFASDFSPHSGCVYKREELNLLKELPIYKTVTGSYTMIVGNDQCIISSTAFFHPKDERCLTHSADSYLFLHALGVNELTDQEVFVRFGLPGFEGKSLEEKENLLLYLHMNWDVLQSDSSIVNRLKETNFIRNASESCTELFKPRDLLDPHDSLLSSIFCGERNRFPGERLAFGLEYFSILVKQNVVPPEFSWGAFHLRSPPPFTDVLKHLLVVGRNNGEDVLACWPTSPGMMTVVDATFEIFKYLDKIWGTLSSTDIKELHKVAFIPVANGTRLVSVKSLFVRLSINLAPFAFELPSIYLPFVKILKEMELQEVLTVEYAREIIFNIQKSCGYQRLNPNELRAIMEILKFICDEYMKSSAERSGWQFDAIVPDDGCRLVSASSCVFVDSYGSQFLGKIDTSRLRFSHPELPENICIFLGIKKISEVVIEVERSLSEVASRLQFVKQLLTRFLLLPKNIDITRVTKDIVIPEWDRSHKHRTMHFVNKTRNIIYVAEPPSYISVHDLVAIVVSQVLELPNIIPFGPLLACPDGSEKAALIAMKLGFETGTMTEGECKSLVGKEVLPQDALQVQFLPMRPFYRGEIVAWKPGNEGTKLRYGIVPQDVRPYSSQAMYKFSVEIAPGEYQTLLSTQVFSFRSVSMGNVVSLLPFSSSSETTSESRLVEEGGNGKAKQQMVKELQYGRVSAEETVRAVNEMLLAAGINMDVEQQKLLQTTLSLQEQVKEFQVALLVEQEKADKAGREADAAKAAWSCRVCLGSEVDTTMVPCGHVMCHRCCSAVSRCPFCRSQVSSKMKIFRP